MVDEEKTEIEDKPEVSCDSCCDEDAGKKDYSKKILKNMIKHTTTAIREVWPEIKKGYVKKGGVNKRPTTPKPDSPPPAQGGTESETVDGCNEKCDLSASELHKTNIKVNEILARLEVLEKHNRDIGISIKNNIDSMCEAMTELSELQKNPDKNQLPVLIPRIQSNPDNNGNNKVGE